MNRARLYLLSGLIGVFVGQYVAIYVLAHIRAKDLIEELEIYLEHI